MALSISDTHKCQNPYAGDILSVVSSLLSEDDVLHGIVDPTCMCIGQQSIGVYHDVLTMILGVASAMKRKMEKNIEKNVKGRQKQIDFKIIL